MRLHAIASRRAIIASAGAAAVVFGVTPALATTASGTLTGIVYEDLNGNGVQDSGEPGMANEQLYLFGSSGYVAATATDSSGRYAFTGLATGTYTVRFASQTWWSIDNDWALTGWTPTPGDLSPSVTASVMTAAVGDLPMRPIHRSTDFSAPLSSYQAPNGLVVKSYDDVVSASDVYNALASGTLFGPEAASTSVYFDYNSATDATTGESGAAPGSYSNFTASLWISYSSWLSNYDEVLFHEYGHAWGNYNAYIVQQDPDYTSYLKARGLYGNPNLYSDKYWDPNELLAEDYRQLFGSATAAAVAQANTQIPPASQVPGLATFLRDTYTASPAPTALPAPAVSSVSPGAAPSTGGTTVTINGSNFGGSGWNVSSVQFGNAPASSVTVTSPTQLTAVAPAGSGTVDVTVTTTDSSGAVETSSTSSGDQFTYMPRPAVTGLSPSSGPMKGGTSVTITGTGFSGPGWTTQAVYFGSVKATSFSVTSATQIVVTTPASAKTTTVDVMVATAAGTSTTSTSDRFSYTRK